MLVGSQLAQSFSNFFIFSLDASALRETEQGVFSLHIHMDGTQNAVSQFSV